MTPKVAISLGQPSVAPISSPNPAAWPSSMNCHACRPLRARKPTLTTRARLISSALASTADELRHDVPIT